MRLYVATSNPGKLQDFALAAEDVRRGDGSPLRSLEFQIEPLPSLAGIAAPEESEPTFEGNARLKAAYYSRLAPGQCVLADDSGLEVTCLDGAPGVRSARYADDQRFPSAPGSTADERNNAALLRALDGVPEPCRQARYRCVLALARDGSILATSEGALAGQILAAPRGDGGFGYDPLFLIEGRGLTMAEIGPNERLQFSHRARALCALLEQLRNSPG